MKKRFLKYISFKTIVKRWDGEIFMKKILQSFLVIAFTVTLTMFLPTLMQAQSALSGKVIDEEGKPLEGAIISFDRVNVEHHVEVKSDETVGILWEA